MLYPYVNLPDGTEINYSHIIETDGIPTVEVHFERPTEEGFDTARCVLPYCEWKFCEGFSETEKAFFEEFLRSNTHLIYRCAEKKTS